MNGLLLLAWRVEASLILSAYKSLVKNHWSPGPISLSFLLASAKNVPEAKKMATINPRSSAHSAALTGV